MYRKTLPLRGLFVIFCPACLSFLAIYYAAVRSFRAHDGVFELNVNIHVQGDSDVISMPAGFRRHLVGKTLINVFHYDIAEIRFVGKLVIIQTFS